MSATDQQLETIRTTFAQVQSFVERQETQRREDFVWIRGRYEDIDERLRAIEQEATRSASVVDDVKSLAERLRAVEMRFARLMGWASAAGLSAAAGFELVARLAFG